MKLRSKGLAKISPAYVRSSFRLYVRLDVRRHIRPGVCSHVDRGAVMVETVLALPFILLILLLLFFAGQVYLRQQKQQALAHYGTWRQVLEANGPSSESNLIDDLVLSTNVNALPDLTWSHVSTFPDYTHTVHVNAVANFSGDASVFTEQVIEELPSGTVGTYAADYPATGVIQTLTNWFGAGYDRDQQAFVLRLDQPWPHVLDEGLEHPADGSTDTVGHHDIIRDERLADLSDQLEALSQGNEVADMIDLTLGRLTHYRGPAFPGQ